MPAENQFVQAAIETFRSQKELVERAIKQLDDEQLRRPLDENTNSTAVIMKHMAGNMISRWTDFLTTDGEKTWRNRDNEFVDDFADRAAITEYWNRGWQCLFEALDQLTENDLNAIVKIRGQPHTVPQAITRQISHKSYHTGQIVLIARILAGDNWEVLSIPRGQSEQYNQRVWIKDDV